MSRKNILRKSIILSVILHLVFFGTSMVWWVPGAQGIVQKTKKMFDIQSVELKKSTIAQEKVIRKYVEKIKFQNPGNRTTDNAVKKIPMKALERPSISSETLMEAELSKPSLLPEGQSELLKESMAVEKREVVAPSTRDLNVSKLETTQGGVATGDIEVPDLFKEEMFAFTPKSIVSSRSDVDSMSVLSNSTGLVPISDITSIESLMDVRVETYRDPQDGQGYFKISVSPSEDANQLTVMPKEIIFLVDASLSIRSKRLDHFIKGIKYALNHLNPEDRFNIYIFKDHIKPFMPTSQVADERTIEKAIHFLNGLEPSKQTDLYEAFLESIQSKASMDPSYIVLLSDGRPTYGITSSAKLIGEISRINKKQRSIFAFSGGARVNRYLLDFLAYQNRGWSEYAKDIHTIRENISNLYDKIRNPLLTDLKFQFNGINENEIYPKYLPDFYLNTAFVVYGKYSSEDMFSMRVLGEVHQEPKEFIFQKSLSEAQPGDASIARAWAFNKYYDLISQINLGGPNPEIEKELEVLGRKFGIESPYSS